MWGRAALGQGAGDPGVRSARVCVEGCLAGVPRHLGRVGAECSSRKGGRVAGLLTATATGDGPGTPVQDLEEGPLALGARLPLGSVCRRPGVAGDRHSLKSSPATAPKVQGAESLLEARLQTQDKGG